MSRGYGGGRYGGCGCGLALLVLLFFVAAYWWLIVLVVVGGIVLYIVAQAQEQRRIADSDIAQVDTMSGIEFEQFLRTLFQRAGYGVEMTPASGDYGADLILRAAKQTIAVQAKRCGNPVGVAAVQASHSAQSYYHTDEAWVVTNNQFTPAATALAARCSVRLIDREKLIALINQSREVGRSSEPDVIPVPLTHSVQPTGSGPSANSAPVIRYVPSVSYVHRWWRPMTLEQVHTCFAKGRLWRSDGWDTRCTAYETSGGTIDTHTTVTKVELATPALNCIQMGWFCEDSMKSEEEIDATARGMQSEQPDSIDFTVGIVTTRQADYLNRITFALVTDKGQCVEQIEMKEPDILPVGTGSEVSIFGLLSPQFRLDGGEVTEKIKWLRFWIMDGVTKIPVTFWIDGSSIIQYDQNPPVKVNIPHR